MANEYDEESTFEEDIEAILTTDPVKGDPPGFSGTLTGKINVVLFHIVNRTRWLKDALAALNITVPNASTTTKGIAELATKSEAEAVTDTTRITPPKRVHDILKHSNAQATEIQRGTAEIATNSEAEGGTDDTRIMTSAKTKRYLEHSNAQATTSKRGTVKKATQAQVDTGTNEKEYVTPETFKNSKHLQGIVAAATATISVSSGTITVRTNIVIGKLLFMRVENTGSSSISDTVTWTLGGGAWRFLSVSYEDHYADVDIIIQMGRLNSSQNTSVKNVAYNSNNTTFNIGSAMANSEVISIIAVLNS